MAEQINNQMKNKQAIEQKVIELQEQVEALEIQIRTIIWGQLTIDYMKVRETCNSINVACSRIEILNGVIESLNETDD